MSAGGDSDHMAIVVTKFRREVKVMPKTVKKRNYKNFNAEAFLNDVLNSKQTGAFKKVEKSCSPDEAAAIFSGIFGSILNKHAPLKIFQFRNNYVPWLSKEMSNETKRRDKLKEDAIEEENIEKLKEYKTVRNDIRNKVGLEEEKVLEK